MIDMHSAFWLTNARLESGYEVQDGVITGTKTEIRHIFIEDGKIARIAASDTTISDEWPQHDVKGLLLLPSFIEKHCHLDKTLLGD